MTTTLAENATSLNSTTTKMTPTVSQNSTIPSVVVAGVTLMMSTPASSLCIQERFRSRMNSMTFYSITLKFNDWTVLHCNIQYVTYTQFVTISEKRFRRLSLTYRMLPTVCYIRYATYFNLLRIQKRQIFNFWSFCWLFYMQSKDDQCVNDGYKLWKSKWRLWLSSLSI